MLYLVALDCGQTFLKQNKDYFRNFWQGFKNTCKIFLETSF